MDFNYRIPHAAGEIALSVTGAGPQAAVAAIQMGFEIVNMLGGQVAPDAAPVEIVPEPVATMPEPGEQQEPATDQNPVDSAGVPFDPELHTGTLKKDGTWRLKRGAAKGEENEEGNAEGGEVETTTATETVEAAETTATEDASPSDLPEISDAELQRYCGRLAAHFGGPEKVFDLAKAFVPEGEMPRPSNIKDQASRHAFIAKAQEETGVAYHG